ncbi:hypothetical protein HYH03_015182 [Edaphochlamys debaryana]|uniref:Uncharacterized protein n=1 Tax=Edaphochlamys debaryana TaxID=47281 RepID=A0A836BRI8_9CHLO|nr:hypothetical protein HYH03_015182 [Edaphochlamys debaryana]|eukprot:KAG2486220.1 hypothetical protein HYH03_015182 [Edaphochlamys debaryana]
MALSSARTPPRQSTAHASARQSPGTTAAARRTLDRSVQHLPGGVTASASDAVTAQLPNLTYAAACASAATPSHFLLFPTANAERGPLYLPLEILADLQSRMAAGDSGVDDVTQALIALGTIEVPDAPGMQEPAAAPAAHVVQAHQDAVRRAASLGCSASTSTPAGGISATPRPDTRQRTTSTGSALVSGTGAPSVGGTNPYSVYRSFKPSAARSSADKALCARLMAAAGPALAALPLRDLALVVVVTRGVAGWTLTSLPFCAAGLECLRLASGEVLEALEADKARAGADDLSLVQWWLALCAENGVEAPTSRGVATLPEWVESEFPAMAALLRHRHWRGAARSQLVAEAAGLVFSCGKKRAGGAALPYTRKRLAELLDTLARFLGLEAPRPRANRTLTRLLTQYVELITRAGAAEAEPQVTAGAGAVAAAGSKQLAEPAAAADAAAAVAPASVAEPKPAASSERRQQVDSVPASAPPSAAAAETTAAGAEAEPGGGEAERVPSAEEAAALAAATDEAIIKLQQLLFQLVPPQHFQLALLLMALGEGPRAVEMVEAALRCEATAVDHMLQAALGLIGGGACLAAWEQEHQRRPESRSDLVDALAEAVEAFGKYDNLNAWITADWDSSAASAQPARPPIIIQVTSTTHFTQEFLVAPNTPKYYPMPGCAKQLTGLAWSLGGGAVRHSSDPEFSSGAGGSSEAALWAAMDALMADVAAAGEMVLHGAGHDLACLAAWLTRRSRMDDAKLLMAKRLA